MAKAYLFTDMHISPMKGNELFVDTAMGCLNNIINQAEKNKIEYLFCLGDSFHNKDIIESYVLPHIKPTFERLRNFKTYFVVGNHDLVRKTESKECLINLFDEYLNVIPDPYTAIEIDGNNFIFCNYAGNDHISDENLPVKKGKKNVLFGHFDCNGFYVNNGYEQKTAKIDKHNLRMFDMVFSGHYHRRNEHKNMLYIGATHHQGKRDAGNVFGFVELDLKTLDYTFKKYEGYEPPCFYEYSIKDLDKIKKVKNGFINITSTEEDNKKITNAKLIEIKEELKKNNYEVDFSTKKNEQSIEIANEEKLSGFDARTIVNIEDMIDVYIENVETGLDKKKLKKIIKA